MAFSTCAFCCALLFLIISTATCESGSSDRFAFPVDDNTSFEDNQDFADDDTLRVQWHQSMPNSTIQFTCCDSSKVCPVLYSKIFNNHQSGQSNLNFTLSYGTQNNCYFNVTASEPSANSFQTAKFAISPARDTPTYWTSPKQNSSNDQQGRNGIAFSSGPQSRSLGAASTSDNTSNQTNAQTSGNARPIQAGPHNSKRSPSPPVGLGLNEPPEEDIPEHCLYSGENQYHEECWTKLKIDEWIPAWIRRYYPCAENQTCNETTTKPWTSYFLERAYGDDWKKNCSTLEKEQACSVEQYEPPHPQQDTLEARVLYSRYRHVSYAISGIWTFYNEWHDKTDKAIIQKADSIEAITNIVDPKKKPSIFKSIFLSLLTGLIGLIPELGPEVSLIFRTIVFIGKNAVEAVPGIVDAFSKTGNDQLQQEVTLTQLLQGNNLVSFQELLKYAIAGILGATMGVEGITNGTKTDYDLFRNFTRAGNYVYVDTNYESPMNRLDSDIIFGNAITTWISSVSLVKNGYYVVLLPGIDPVNLYNNPGDYCPRWAGKNCNHKSRDLGCKGQLDEYHMCDYLWYSDALQSSFTLRAKNGKTDKKRIKDILHQLLDGNYTTGISLFENAAYCELASAFPPTSNVIKGQHLGENGFIYNANTFPEIKDTSETINDTFSFVSIDGRNRSAWNAFVDLGKNPDFFNKKLIHPNQTALGFDYAGTPNMDCLSQLNVSVGNTWGGRNPDGWMGQSPDVQDS